MPSIPISRSLRFAYSRVKKGALATRTTMTAARTVQTISLMSENNPCTCVLHKFWSLLSNSNADQIIDIVENVKIFTRFSQDFQRSIFRRSLKFEL